MITKKEDGTLLIECNNCGIELLFNNRNTIFITSQDFHVVDLDMCNNCLEKVMTQFKYQVKREKIAQPVKTRGRPKKDETTTK